MDMRIRSISKLALGLGLGCVVAVGAGPGLRAGAQGTAPDTAAGPWRLFLPALHQVRPPLARAPLPPLEACQVDRFDHREPSALIRDVDVDWRGNLYAVTSLGVAALMADGTWAEWADTADTFRNEASLTRVVRVAVDGQDQPWFGEEVRFTFAPRPNAAEIAVVKGKLWYLDPSESPDPLRWTRHIARGGAQMARRDDIGPVTALTTGPDGGIWSAGRQGRGGSFGIAGGSWRIGAGILRPTGGGAFESIQVPCPGDDAACLEEGASQLLVTPGGDLWLLQPGVGLRLRLADGSWPSVVGGHEIASLRAMALDPSSGALWLAGDASGQLLQARRPGDRWRRHRLPRLPEGTVFPPPLTMAADHRGNLWLGSGEHAAVRWADGRWTLLSDGGALGDGEVVRMWADRGGDVWLDHDRPGASGGVLRVHCP